MRVLRALSAFCAVVSAGAIALACDSLYHVDAKAADAAPGDDAPPPAEDASESDSAVTPVDSSDASDAAVITTPGDGGCDAFAPFTSIQPVTELDVSGLDRDLRLSADGLTAYFSSARAGGAGGFDLYTASRATLTAPFANVVSLPTYNTAQDEYHAAVSVMTSRIVFVRAGTGILEGNLTPVAPMLLSTAGDHTFLTEKGDAVFFDEGSPTALYRAPLSPSGLGTPVAIAELDTTYGETSPVVTADESIIYFSSKRPPGVSNDIHVAQRGDGGTYANITRIAELAGPDDDKPSFITPDLCTLYFYRIGVDGGASAIYAATRTP